MATILIADDDKHFLAVVAKLLAAEGYAVISAANGQEALNQVQAASPDLLVLDVALPLVTGDAIARQVSQPILFISGRDGDRLDGLLGPRRRFLQKPADLDDVLAEVAALLAP